MSVSNPARGALIPTLRYRDAQKAIAFLCDGFGFARKAVYEGKDGTVEHAELTFGDAMVMLGSERDTPFGRLMRPPRETGGVTQGLYVVVPDADAHYARAKAAGAEIVIDIVTQGYGGRDYTCRDPEGYVWTFGTYDPWAANPT